MPIYIFTSIGEVFVKHAGVVMDAILKKVYSYEHH